jgi:hypothetical protein
MLGVAAIRLGVVLLVLLLVERSEKLERWPRRACMLVFAACAAYFALPMLREARYNLAEPREWDFLCFWLWGKTAALRLDFYDPAQTFAVGRSLAVTEEFSRLILHNGFWYPPPTMLLFAPLGLMPLRHAMIAWYTVQAACAGASVWLLGRTFLREHGWLGVFAAGALVAALPPARSTAWFAQTNFLLLLLFVMLLRDRRTARAGVWLALGAIVKPYYLLLGGYFLLTKAYRPLASAALVIAGAIATSAAVFGLAPLATFVSSSPTSRVPGYVYGELINQSLLGTIVRATTGTLQGSVLGQPLYLTLAAALTLATAWSLRRPRERSGDHELGLCLLLALLLYPATLAHYSLVIIAPLFGLFRDRRTLPGGAAGVIGLFVAVYAIFGWDRFESHNFWANLLVWGAVAAGCYAFGRAEARRVVVPARP